MRNSDQLRAARRPFRERESGIALLVVLWVIALLVLLVLVFSNAVQIAVRAATYRKEAAQSYAFACGGVQTAILNIAYRPADDQAPSPLWTWHSGQREGRVPFQGGWADLQIVNEQGKLDLNHASEKALAGTMMARGVAPEDAQKIARALITWRSPNPDANQTSPPPRGGEYTPFETVEEALNVPGMSRRIFFGRAKVDDQGKVSVEPGVGNDWTVRSGSVQLNINYASEAALRSVPGIGASLAQAIVQARRQEPFRTVAEVNDRIAQSLPDVALPYLTTAVVNTWTIISTGVIKGSPVRRTVGAVIQLAPQGSHPYRIVDWYDDYDQE